MKRESIIKCMKDQDETLTESLKPVDPQACDITIDVIAAATDWDNWFNENLVTADFMSSRE